MKANVLKILRCSQSSAQREIYSYERLYSKRIGLYSQIKNLIFQPKKLEKEEQIKPIANIKKKIINTKAEINSRKTIDK